VYGKPGSGLPSAWLSALNKTSPPSDNSQNDYSGKRNQNANQTADQSKDAGNQAGDQNKTASSDQGAKSAADSTNHADKSSGNSGESKADDAANADASADKAAGKFDAGASAAEKPTKPTKAAAADTADDSETPDRPATTKPKPGVRTASAAAAEDKGDASFRKGEAFLYGQSGSAANCDQAIRYLKDASAKSNAKARSTFGTMYATGHCVPRDLPSSYRWFALALQADPNNSILEKDLTAVWNQMTPPERQLATRMKGSGE
jgi:TPR repeat protein